MPRLALAALLLLAAPAWAQAPVINLSTPASPACVSWSVKQINLYQRTVGVDRLLQNFPVDPPVAASWPCPTTSGMYCVSVSFTDVSGAEGSRGPLTCFIVEPFPPPAPAFLAIAPAPSVRAPATYTLSWRPGSTNETHFNVLRKPEACNGPSTFVPVAQTDPGVNTYTDVALPAGTYCYEVNAENLTGASTFTNLAEATVLSAPVPLAFAVGAHVVVSPPTGSLLNVRPAPGADPTLAKVSKGLTATIVDGPIVLNGATWWKLQFPTTLLGWCSQGPAATPYLTLVP